MPDPRYMLTCSYPPVELLELINKSKTIDTIHLYIDLKNSASSLFITDVINEIVNNSRLLQTGVDSTIIQAVLSSIYNWKIWASQNNKKIKIIIANDKGKSMYHRSIIKEYKENRTINNTSLASLQEVFDPIKIKNFDLLEPICNKIDDVYFITLEYLESDFIPYYLITRKYTHNDNIAHVISSNDKDHYQILRFPRTVMFSRKRQENFFYHRNNFYKKFTGAKDMTDEAKRKIFLQKLANIPPEYFSLMLAICGDTSDNVPGVFRIGPKTVAELFSNTSNLKNLFGEYNEIIDRLCSGGCIFKAGFDTNILSDKKWKQIYDARQTLSAAFKAIDYEMLCKWLEDSNHTTKIENIKKINDTVDRSNLDSNGPEKNTIKSGIYKMQDLQLENKVVDYVFG